jgi:arylsulfatase A-like enzyme
MVLNIDIPKTLLDMAALPIPAAYQGESLAPLLGHPRVHLQRSSILIEHLWPIPQIPSSEGVRTSRWKYFRYRYLDAPEELYDLKKDPLEMHNLAADGKYASVLDSLRKQANRLAEQYTNEKRCADDPFIKAKNF